MQLYLLSKGQHLTSLPQEGQAEDLAHTLISPLSHIYYYAHFLCVFPGSLAIFKIDIQGQPLPDRLSSCLWAA